MWRAFSEHRNKVSAATSSALPSRRRPSLAVASCLSCFDRFSRCLRALLDQLIEALGLGRAGMDDIDVDAVTFAELRQRLGEIAHRRIDRSADREIGAGRARRAAADIDDKTLRRLEQRPEQPAHAHAAEQFQRIAVEPGIVRQVDEIAGTGRARRADQNVAAVEFRPSPRRTPAGSRRAGAGPPRRQRRRPAGRGDGLARGGKVSAEEDTMTVCAPARANSTAISRPMPRLPPVMTATLSENSSGIVHPVVLGNEPGRAD